MDGIQPVGAMIQPPPPNQGLNAYSTLLGIQQQQLGIQQQQQGLQGQAAQVSQEQQKNQEMQRAHQVAVDAANGKYTTQDGSLDRMRMSQDISSIGPYAQSMASSLLSQANEVVQNKASIQKLTVERKEEIGNTLQSLIQDPNLNQSKFIDEVERLRSQHPNDPEFSRLLTSTTAMAVGSGDSPDQMRTKLSQLWSSVSGQPQAKPSMLDLGGKVVPGTTGVLTGQFSPAQAGINKILAPTVVSPPGGVPTVIGGGGGGGGGGQGKNMSGFSGPQPTDQEMKDFGEYTTRLNNRVATASDAIPRIQLAEQALQTIRSGGGAPAREEIARRLQAIGAPSSLVDAVAGGDLAKAQEAQKLLFQTTFAGLKQSMQGDPARVAEFEAAEKVFPTIGTDPRASQKILQFMVDQGSRDFAEQRAMVQARKSGTLSPVTWQSDWQSQLRGGAAPGVPKSQVPGTQATNKSMPTGARLQAYADKYTGGDLKKAAAALSEHGYQ